MQLSLVKKEQKSECLLWIVYYYVLENLTLKTINILDKFKMEVLTESQMETSTMYICVYRNVCIFCKTYYYLRFPKISCYRSGFRLITTPKMYLIYKTILTYLGKC